MEKKLILGSALLIIGALALRQTYYAPKPSDVAVEQLATQVDGDNMPTDESEESEETDMSAPEQDEEELDENGKKSPKLTTLPADAQAHDEECAGEACKHDHAK